MKYRNLIIGVLSLIAATPNVVAGGVSANDEGLVISKARMAGPFALQQPLLIDSLSASQKKFSVDKLIDTPLSLGIADKVGEVALADWRTEKGTLNIAAFDLNSTSYVKTKINVKGAKHSKVYVDGKEASGETALQPGVHKVAVKFIADSTAIGLTVGGDSAKLCSVKPATYGTFNMRTNLETRVTRSAALSASGRWATVAYSWYDEQNKTQWETQLIDLTTGRASVIGSIGGWMPRSDRYYRTENIGGKTRLVTVDPLTGKREVLVADLPSRSFDIAPTEDYLVMSDTEEGPKKEDGVFEIIHPDDRQPGWRKRSVLSKMDIATGLVQPLTYGYRSIYTSDISWDGRYLLLAYQTDSLTQRPTTRSTYLRMNMKTLAVDTLIVKDGFIASGRFTKDNDIIVFKASPESFGGVGNIVPKGMTPSNFDYHLYQFDVRTKTVTPLTTNDNTTVESFFVSQADNNVYYTAERADSVLLYCLDLKTRKSRLIRQPLEVINGVDMDAKNGTIIVHGSGACMPYRAYTLNQKTGKSQMVLNPNAELFANIQLGTCHPWQFKTKRGDTVTGHYYLPADFDSKKKYPVIVHYYGGCSPSSRRFGGGSHYPAHYWNALGYIAFTVNPSGATGFGQEWAARHVNTMGAVVVDDIIEATEQFCQDIPQADRERLGCVSASYGGFMTQNILIHTDMFACGISHAGISDHTSYWGEGYWGYSYSETCAANSYPWTRKDLFVDRSPLYNADKIHKPLLFTHGTADTNVPIGESIQMYTALKLLGIPTAFIQVEGENHGIMDPVKRTKWIDSMMAWFQKWLKNDDSWWNATYSRKEL